MRIAIMGGGAAGVSAAYYLAEQGHDQIVVFEKKARLGGKCDSLSFQGSVFDLGAAELTPDYNHVIELANRLQLSMSPVGDTELIDGETGERKPMSYLSHGLGIFGVADLIGDGIDYFRQLYAAAPCVRMPGFRRLAEVEYSDLTLSFADWLRRNSLESLEEAFQMPVPCYGYGQLRDIPAAYVLKYIDRKNWETIVAASGAGALHLDYGWPKRLDQGFETLVQRMAEHVRLSAPGCSFLTSAPVTKVERSEQDRGGVRIYYRQGDADRDAVFDRLIVAGVNGMGFLEPLDIVEEERDIFSKVRVQHYYTTLCEVPGFPVGVFPELLANGQLVLPTGRSPAMYYRPWPSGQSDGVIAYTFYPKATPLDAVEASVRDNFSRMGFAVDSVHENCGWRYFPHFQGEDLRAGIYDRLHALQGRNNTFYCGGLLNFEIVEKVFEFSEYLARELFR